MGFVQDAINAGYGGYAGWSDAAAQADYNATGGTGKITGGSGSSSGSGSSGSTRSSIPPFNFDYAGEAAKAFGELGPYYANLLAEAKGDMTKVLARLVEDYDTGVRTRTQSATTAQNNQNINENSSLTNIENNALGRGLYQRSNFDPTASTSTGPAVSNSPQPLFGGFGIPDASAAKTTAAYDTQTATRNTNLADANAAAALSKDRQSTDATTNEQRKETQLGEQQKQQAGDIANQRGQQAYQNYLAQFSGY